MNTRDMRDFLVGFEWTTTVIERYGEKFPHLVVPFSRQKEPLKSFWYSEGCRMAIEAGERTWRDRQNIGGYRGLP